VNVVQRRVVVSAGFSAMPICGAARRHGGRSAGLGAGAWWNNRELEKARMRWRYLLGRPTGRVFFGGPATDWGPLVTLRMARAAVSLLGSAARARVMRRQPILAAPMHLAAARAAFFPHHQAHANGGMPIPPWLRPSLLCGGGMAGRGGLRAGHRFMSMAGQNPGQSGGNRAREEELLADYPRRRHRLFDV